VTLFNDIEQDERKTAILVCEARGDPVPQMSFRKVGNEADYLPADNVRMMAAYFTSDDVHGLHG
jgi:hypothetical protein